MNNPYHSIWIDGIQIDLQALQSISTHCPAKGCQASPMCCNSYEVCVEEEELEGLLGLIDQARKEHDVLNGEGDLTFPLEESDDGLYAIDTDEDNLCVLAYRNSQKAILCSLHTTALKLGLSPLQVKPKSCALWPLSLSEGSNPLLSVSDDVVDFPCNKKRNGKVNGLDKGIATIIKDVFGVRFLQQVLEATTF